LFNNVAAGIIQTPCPKTKVTRQYSSTICHRSNILCCWHYLRRL